jgi:hypothetical protein
VSGEIMEPSEYLKGRYGRINLKLEEFDNNPT